VHNSARPGPALPVQDTHRACSRTQVVAARLAATLVEALIKVRAPMLLVELLQGLLGLGDLLLDLLAVHPCPEAPSVGPGAGGWPELCPAAHTVDLTRGKEIQLVSLTGSKLVPPEACLWASQCPLRRWRRGGSVSRVCGEFKCVSYILNSVILRLRRVPSDVLESIDGHHLSRGSGVLWEASHRLLLAH
jgi:hypothetical protein